MIGSCVLHAEGSTSLLKKLSKTSLFWSAYYANKRLLNVLPEECDELVISSVLTKEVQNEVKS